jgi:hypothetical protein
MKLSEQDLETEISDGNIHLNIAQLGRLGFFYGN